MTRSTRAFLATALIALPGAALLHLLALLGVSSAWPAMVHLTLFGWITPMIAAVSYHTMPVFAARDFPTPRLIWAHWAAVNSGVALTTLGLLVGWSVGATIGFLFQISAALIFVANTILLFTRGPQRAGRPPIPPIAGQPQVDRLGTSATKAAGLALPLALLLMLAVRLGWINGAWMLAAEHLAALGWVMLMIVGVAYHVLPRFSGRATRGAGWARAQMLCHIGALALIVLALGFGWAGIFAAGGLLMALGLGLFAWTVWPTLRRLEIRDWRFTPTQSPTLRLRSGQVSNLQSPIPLEERTK